MRRHLYRIVNSGSEVGRYGGPWSFVDHNLAEVIDALAKSARVPPEHVVDMLLKKGLGMSVDHNLEKKIEIHNHVDYSTRNFNFLSNNVWITRVAIILKAVLPISLEDAKIATPWVLLSLAGASLLIIGALIALS